MKQNNHISRRSMFKMAESGGESREGKRAETIYVTGSARLPDSVTESVGVKNMQMGWEVNTENNEVTDVLCTLILYELLPKSFLSSLFVGYSLGDGIEGKVNEIDSRCQISFKKSLIACVEDTYNNYLKHFKRTKQ